MARIVDGDTLDIELRLPCRIRLLDCWAEELSTVEGSRAKLQLELMSPVGSHVRVHIPTQDASSLTDIMTFGRVLGHVWREGDEESIGSLMVRSGHALEYKP